MAVRRPRIRRTSHLLVRRVEHDAIVAALQRRIDELEHDRDQIRLGFEVLTKALRRRGCCESAANGHKRG